MMQKDINKAYISHIIAAKEDGPRGDKELSEKLEVAYENLMLLCDECHNRIDEADPKNHPVGYLQAMKVEHEERIEVLTDIGIDKRSHIVVYRANVGVHTPVLNFETVRSYLPPERYPAAPRAIDLGMINSPQRDKDDSFWQSEISSLETLFIEQLKPRLRKGEIEHLSIFAFAPIPLLVKLGTLINDIQHAEVHQPIRNPKSWKWQPDDGYNEVRYLVHSPKEKQAQVALNLSLSATITNDRIHRVLGEDVAIFTLTIEEPFNDFLKCRKHLQSFSKELRLLLNQIKAQYGSEVPLHVFPAMPISAAVELGRSWMPKADMSLLLYDENTAVEGFRQVIEIQNY